MNHANMDCKAIMKNLNAYIDGEMDETLCADIEAHIETCPKCQIVVNTLKKTIYLYKEDGRETILPSATRCRLFACLDLDEYVVDD